MPVVSKETDNASAKAFRRNFLEAGGLKYVISVLQSKALPTNVDLSVRQDCYEMALSLARCVHLFLAFVYYVMGCHIW